MIFRYGVLLSSYDRLRAVPAPLCLGELDGRSALRDCIYSFFGCPANKRLLGNKTDGVP